MSDWDLLSSYAGLLTLATFSVYTGSFGSLPVRSLDLNSNTFVCFILRVTAQPTKQKPIDGAGPGVADEDEEEQPERLSSEDAWLFPVVRLSFIVICVNGLAERP